jgi:hypothetical protein
LGGRGGIVLKGRGSFHATFESKGWTLVFGEEWSTYGVVCEKSSGGKEEGEIEAI